MIVINPNLIKQIVSNHNVKRIYWDDYALNQLEIDNEKIWDYPPVQYILSEDKTHYLVEATDKLVEGDITFDSTYNNLPVTTIALWAFNECYDLTGITIPNGVKTIDYYAFMNCNELARVELPSSVETIGKSAFEGCTLLKNITIPDKVKFIDYQTFYKCTSLENVVIGDGVITIDENAFRDSSISNILIIGKSVKFIGKSAFNCTLPNKIYYRGNPDDWVKIDIENEGNVKFKGVTRYYYRESHPIDIGNYWHYPAPGEIEDWCADIISYDAKAPTCEDVGWDAYITCSKCGYTTYNELKALGHIIINDEAKPPTCTETGLTSGYHCAREGCSHGVAQEVIPALGHTEEIIPAIKGSCTTEGWTEGKKCSVCGEVLVEPKNIGIQHTSGIPVKENNIPATCTTNGSYDNVVYCTVCGEELSRISETVKALGHSESDWIIDVAPTCITSGFRHTECTRCGETIREEEFYLTHNYINGNCEHCGATSDEYFDFTLLDDGTYSITVKDHINIPTNVVIPRVHDGRTVTNIGSEAFRYCMGVTSVVIPDCVTSISDNAFYLCKSITSVAIPDSVTSIGDEAFSWCSSLTSVAIPDSVTSIGSSAFEDCSSLASVIIGDSVTSIGEMAFAYCSSLTNVEIGNSVTSISYSAFRDCSSLASIIIPDRVTSIGNYAFEGCSGLISIVLPKSVTSIGNNAFSGCSSLASIYFCGTYTEYTVTTGSNATIYYYSESEPSYSIFFKYWRWVDGKPKVWCKHTIVIDKAVKATCTTDGLTEGKHCSECGEIIVAQEVVPATGHNYGPITVTTNPTCTKFGNGTRKCVACGNVEPVIIDKLPHKYGDWYAYEGGYRRDCTYGCNHYEISSGDYAGLAFTLLSDGTYAVSALDIQAIPSVLNIPGTYNGNVVSTIDDYAFEDCVTITKVRIPDTITTIGWGAFAYCSMLQTVEIGENSRLKSIGNEAFYETTDLTTINLPNSLETIGDSAFAWSNIRTIEIPDNVTSLGKECFYDSRLVTITFGENSKLSIIDERTFVSTGLRSITIPSSVTHICERAFYDSTLLETVTFAENSQLKRIWERAFSICGLTSLTVPEGCFAIGDGAFSQCTDLATINLPSTLEAIGEESAESVFQNTAYYNDDKNWNKGALYIGEYLICIREEEFSGGGGIFIPSIKTVATGAVSGWSKNAEIIIPLSVERIQPCAIVDSENVTVYCEAESKPEGWVDNWCDDSVTVVWGYVEDTNIYLVTEDGAYLTDEQGRLLII